MKPTFRTNNLIEMFNSLQPLVEQSHSYELKEELQQAQQTYETMLRYMVRGVDDPNSSNIYSQLKQKAYSISDRANRLIRLEKMSSDRYSITQKLLKEESLDTILMALETQDSAIHRLEKETERESIKEHELVELRNSREATLRSMFENVWTSGLWRKSNYESATAIINSDSIAIPGKALLISAVTMALLEMFDQRKMMLLFDAYLSTELELSQRALVGIVLCMRFYDERLSQFPEIGSRFSLYTEDPKFVQDFFRILMQLQYSKMTDTIDSKMRNDIIPSLLQSGKFKQTQYGIQEIDDYMTKNGENPEWHHNKNDEKAQEKIKEMAELQMDGADVYMSSFVHMKNYPFFQQIFHWFMPFDIENPLVASSMKKISGGSSFLSSLIYIAPFCHSDRYSLCFMMESIGSMGQDLMMKNLSNEMSGEEMDEHMKELKQRKVKAKEVSRNYIFDLYRFFHIYPYRPQFYNPFKKEEASFSLNTSAFKSLLKYEDEVIALAEFFMRKGLYEEALSMFKSLEPKEREEYADIWQKMGFCEQKMQNIPAAFNDYKIAYNLNPNSDWTLKHLANAAFLIENYEEAEIYYDTLLDNDADNLKLIARKVGCLMKMHQYESAVPLLYKTSYLDETSIEAKNNLAFCQLMLGNTEKAKDIYQTVLEQNPQSNEALFNLANVHFVTGNLTEAYQLYRQAYHILFQKGEIKSLKKQFVDLAKALKQLDINPKRVEMLYDAVVTGANEMEIL
ncbi:MAG: tetratricopeptide repeat protein [Bacteroidaceae bacterium]|nr:tetratricopeptide repeat protein [Bacteroidaceae bacterium]